jgi:hypothetical protein
MIGQGGAKRNFTLLNGGAKTAETVRPNFYTMKPVGLMRAYKTNALSSAELKAPNQTPPKTEAAGAPSIPPFGLFELDASGIVRHYAPSDVFAEQVEKSSVIGRNFFTELIPLEQGRDWQVRFRTFMAGCGKTDKFDGVFNHEGRAVKIHFVLAHLSERSEQGHRRMALVRVMPGN